MINVNVSVNTLTYNKNYDPTHTTVLRNLFVSDVNRRFAEIVFVIKKTVVDNDCFGLQKGIQTHQVVPAGWQAFNYRLSQEKIAKFMEWLQIQVNNGILDIREYEQIGNAINSAWTNKYIFDSYKRGVIRARYELQKAGYNVPSIEQTGGIEISMALPIHLDRLGLLYTRAYTDLKGITEVMDTYISRILAQGLADGDSPILLARKMVATINGQGLGDLGITDTLGRFIPAKLRAETLARTEIIRSHHIATIQEYRNWAVYNVIVQAEVITAGDDKVCLACEALEKGGPYTLDEAEKLIPNHPNCRCCTIPLVMN
jgi:SPP1 gp7 family putative phage head morphogenesis protein